MEEGRQMSQRFENASLCPGKIPTFFDLLFLLELAAFSLATTLVCLFVSFFNFPAD